MSEVIEWQAYEYEYKERSPDWYWAVSIIAVSIVITAVILGNTLLAVLIVISIFSLFAHAARKPQLITHRLTSKGVHEGKRFHHFNTLESFWVDEEAGIPKLLIKEKSVFSPFIILPLEETDSEAVREFLAAHLEEVEHHEPVSKKIMEFLG